MVGLQHSRRRRLSSDIRWHCAAGPNVLPRSIGPPSKSVKPSAGGIDLNRLLAAIGNEHTVDKRHSCNAMVLARRSANTCPASAPATARRPVGQWSR